MPAFSDAMREALRLTRAGDLRDATRVIGHALRRPDTAHAADSDTTVHARPDAASAIGIALRTLPRPAPARHEPPHDDESPAAGKPRHAGRFIAGVYSGAAGTRAYKLWVPSIAAETRRLPLIVMLHGCTQDADDFARGTHMNDYGERHGCHVLYPIQDGAANAQRCWRWFDPAHQRRDGGEPAILAGMTQQLVAEHGIDADRVYVAGLSAGAAMAMILGATHPDVFAAIAVHSGLPLGAARDVPTAFAAMAGRSTPNPQPAARRNDSRPLPALVIHGESDRTVRASNGDAVVGQLTQRYADAGNPLLQKIEATPTHTTARFYAVDGRLVVEQWTLKHAGHAWSGGAASGSYTDPNGPDASARMVEFFLTHSRRERLAV